MRPGTLQNFGWTGGELVAFRLHLPSRIVYHNARDLETNETSDIARGNILSWEQHLTDRLDGRPISIEVKMDRQSILHRTLWLFAGAFAAAVPLIGALIWLTMRKGAKEGDARVSQLLRISASVRRSFVTENSPKPTASDRASIRSTLLFTTPVSVTCPPSTMM